MKFFTKAQLKQLRENYAINAQRLIRGEEPLDFKPVVKLYIPTTYHIWLLTELGGNDRAYGLRDWGLRCPILGCFDFKEVESIHRPNGPFAIKYDSNFLPNKTLSEYDAIAKKVRRIIA